MMTVNEAANLSGVSVRTLHYYDEIGLLHPACTTDAGYRLYDDASMAQLQEIMLLRELEFPLKEIAAIIGSDHFNRQKALTQQITLLEMKKAHISRLIAHAKQLKEKGEMNMDFSVFDKTKMNEYAKKAREQWGKTDAYREYDEKNVQKTEDEQMDAAQGLMRIFSEFGEIKNTPADGEAAQALVKKLQKYITEHFYTCTDEILSGLGQMYAAGGEFTENIDRAGGAGCAQFCRDAIAAFCGK